MHDSIRVKAGAVKGLQKIGVAVHSSFYCRLQKELLVFLLNLKIIAVCGVFRSLLEMKMHSSSPLKVCGKMRIQLRITTDHNRWKISANCKLKVDSGDIY